MKSVLAAALLFTGCAVELSGAPCETDDNCPRAQYCDEGKCRAGSPPPTVSVAAAVLASIQVTPVAPVVPKGGTWPLVATGVYSDQSTQDLSSLVAWSSSAPGVVSVSNAPGSKGLLTAVALGSAVVSASHGGLSGSTPVTVIAPALTGLSVSPQGASLPKGTTGQLIATGSFSDGSTAELTSLVSWSSLDPAVASVSSAPGSKGLVSGKGAGSTAIFAAQGGQTASVAVVVTAPALESIAVTPTNQSIAKGTTSPLVATGTYTDQSKQDVTSLVTWRSSNGAVASVSNSPGTRGLVTALSAGTASISAELGGLGGSTLVIVTTAALTSVSVTPTNPAIAAGTSKRLQATGLFSDGSSQDVTAQASWASSSTAVATVSNASGSNGLATGVGAGAATLTATVLGTAGSTTLTVTGASLSSIAVTPTNPSIAKGTTQQLIATGTYSDLTTQDLTSQVSWTTSAPAVATLSANGLAAGAGAGTSTLSASVAGKSGSTMLTVTAAALTALLVSPVDPSVAKGATRQLTATGTFSDGSTQDLTVPVTWGSSNTAVAAISNAASSNGLANALSVGASSISATASGVTGATTLSVTAATLSSIAVTPANTSMPRGASRQFTAAGTYSDGSTQDLTASVTWASSSTAIATVSNATGSKGLVSAVNAGSSTLSATLSGVTGFTPLAVTATTLSSISVAPAAAPVQKGSSRQFTATGTYSDGSTQDITAAVTWTSSNSSVASISNAAGSNGLATGLAGGTATVTAALAGQSGSATLTVVAVSSIAVTPANASIQRNATQAFTATGTYSDGSTANVTAACLWSSSNTFVATISKAEGTRGVATGVNPGPTTISASVDGVSGSTMLTVTY